MAALLVAAAVGPGACGRGGDTPRDVITRAADRTAAARTFHLTMQTWTDGVLSQQRVGGVDVDRDVSWWADGTDPAAPPDQIDVPGKWYQRADVLPEELRPPTPWLVHDFAAEREAAARGNSGVAVLQASPVDADEYPLTSAVGGAWSAMVGYPIDTLDALRRAGEVHDAGEDQIRGIVTTRLDVAIGTDAWRAEQRRLLRHAARNARAGAGADSIYDGLLAAVDTLPAPTISVWVDRDDLVRRIDTAMRMPRPDHTPSPELRVRTELFDFGVAIDVREPPAGEVTSFLDLPRSVPPPSPPDESRMGAGGVLPERGAAGVP